MSRLIILQGPPASGKSTWAREQQAKDPIHTVIVNRDSIRNGRGVYCIPSQEDYVTAIEDASIKAGLDAGYTVIVDSTNLCEAAITRVAELEKEYGLKAEYKEFYVPFSVAVERDRKRGLLGGTSIGQHAVKRFYSKYYPEKLKEGGYEDKTCGLTDTRKIQLPDKSLPTCVVCDLDGTLAIHRDRGAFDYDKLTTDYADPRLVRVLQHMLESGVHVVFLSGRENKDKVYEDTLNWIRGAVGDEYLYGEKLSGKYPRFELHMRECNDHRSDDIVKKEIYEREIKGKMDVMAVFDDRDKVVKMWREEGLLCCQVYYGNF